MSAPANWHEANARARKVEAMSAVLDALFRRERAGARQAFTVVRGMTREQLRELSKVAGVLPPSEQTRLALVQAYWRRMGAADKAQAALAEMGR